MHGIFPAVGERANVESHMLLLCCVRCHGEQQRLIVGQHCQEQLLCAELEHELVLDLRHVLRQVVGIGCVLVHHVIENSVAELTNQAARPVLRSCQHFLYSIQEFTLLLFLVVHHAHRTVHAPLARHSFAPIRVPAPRPPTPGPPTAPRCRRRSRAAVAALHPRPSQLLSLGLLLAHFFLHLNVENAATVFENGHEQLGEAEVAHEILTEVEWLQQAPLQRVPHDPALIAPAHLHRMPAAATIHERLQLCQLLDHVQDSVLRKDHPLPPPAHLPRPVVVRVVLRFHAIFQHLLQAHQVVLEARQAGCQCVYSAHLLLGYLDKVERVLTKESRRRHNDAVGHRHRALRGCRGERGLRGLE